MSRIHHLDMLRGFALVCIMLDHMPRSVLSQLTIRNVAIYDAAELFVLISGFLVGMVWLKVEGRQGLPAARWRFARRAFQVWLALLAGSVLLALLSRALFDLGLDHTAVWSQYAVWIVENPLGYVLSVALMWMQPNLLDVLALYVVLLATVPVLVPLLIRRPLAFAAASFAVWALAVPLNAMVPNHRTEGGLLFNAFGWQALFYAGVAIGLFRARIMAALRPWSPWVTTVAAAVTIYSLAMVTLWRFGPEGKRIADLLWHAVGLVEKWRLDEMRFAAALAACWLVAVPLAGPAAALARTGLGRALGTIGRGGLLSFVACVLLSVLGDAMMIAGGEGWWVRLAVDLATMLALWLVAGAWLHRTAPQPAPRGSTAAAG